MEETQKESKAHYALPLPSIVADRHDNTALASIRSYREAKVSATGGGKEFKSSKDSSGKGLGALVGWARLTLIRIFLPDGYPDSVAPGYLPYLLLNNSASFFAQLEGAIDEYAFLKGVGFADKVGA